MNIADLKKYQSDAVENIVNKSISFLTTDIYKENIPRILFKSPTGSGKTVMMSFVIDKMIDESEDDLCFVWVSVGGLAKQSKESLEEKIGGGQVTFSFLENVTDKTIKQNEILFLNWEQIHSKANKDSEEKDIKKGDYTNVFMRDNESNRNLNNFCKNAREENRKIILIIDESQLNVTENTIKIIDEIIKPSLQIDVTATPKSVTEYNHIENVELEVVKMAQMIKNNIAINIDVTEEDLKKGGDQFILDKAIEKRSELLEIFKSLDKKINPLVLIQLPNDGEKMSATDESKIEFVEKYLTEKGVDYKNKKLAKWLNGTNKENLEKITEIDNEVEFLIFKLAIAKGWDCPRAHILVKFREVKSETFEIQTVGRIMRMPEVMHYEKEELNTAYVYANLEEININQECIDYLKTKEAKRIDSYLDINLESNYLIRGDFNNLLLDYRKYFFNSFIEKLGGDLNILEKEENLNKLKKQKSVDGSLFDFNTNDYFDKIIINKSISKIDEVSNLKADKKDKIIKSDDEINKKFEVFLKASCEDFNAAKSVENLKQSMYLFFENYLGINNKKDVQKLVLNNGSFFSFILNNSIKEYFKNREKVKKSFKVNNNWNVPKDDLYQKDSVLKDYSKCVSSPVYILEKWKTEVGFIENYLEVNKNIVWWYKNGDSKNEKYLGVKVETETGKSTFYPDFIVMYSDGRVGIFDTKSGQTATSEDTKNKAIALQKYAKEQNKKGKNIFGGILRPINDNKVWQINSSDNYDLDKWTNL